MDDPSADEELSKPAQLLITFGIGGVGCYFLWPHLEGISKGLVVIFALLACSSIYSGTWMQNSRDLRRQQRDDRRKTYREASEYLFGKSKAS